MSFDYEGFAMALDTDAYAEDAKWKADTLISLLPDGYKANSILEVGCAAGLVMKQVGEYVGAKRVVGIDISNRMLEYARNRNSGAELHQYDVNDGLLRMFGTDEFDVVILSDILEHIDNPHSLIIEAIRVGKSVLAKIPAEKCVFIGGVDKHSGGHINLWSVKDVLGMMPLVMKWKVDEPPTKVQFRSWFAKGLKGKFRPNPIYLMFTATRFGIWYCCRPLWRKLWGATVFAYIMRGE